jgi:hypothetical protein
MELKEKELDKEIGIINNSTELIKEQIKLISDSLNKMKSNVSSNLRAKEYYKWILDSENDIIDSCTTIIKRVLKRILKLLSLTDSNDSESLKGFKKAFVIMLGILVFYFNYFKFLIWVNDVINR